MKIYRKGQGTAARWVTAAGLGVFVLFGCFKLNEVIGYAVEIPIGRWEVSLGLLVSGLVFLGCAAGIAWVVNGRRTVDFLVLTEAELKKVSWPTKDQLSRQTIVVLVTVVALAAFILVADLCFGGIMKILWR